MERYLLISILLDEVPLRILKRWLRLLHDICVGCWTFDTALSVRDGGASLRTLRLRTDVPDFVFVLYYLVLRVFVFVALSGWVFLHQILDARVSHSRRGSHHLRLLVLICQLCILALKLLRLLLKELLPLVVQFCQLVRVQA